MTGILGAGLGLSAGVSPSRLSAGAARRSEWPGLSVDVLLDDRLLALGADIACEKLDTSHGRRTSRAACGTGHQGCSWTRSDARLKVPAAIVSTSTPPERPPCLKRVCVENAGKSRLPTGPPLLRDQRASGCVLGLPRTARPSRRGWLRSAGSAGSQPGLAASSRHRRVPRSSRCSIETTRPQTPAHAEVSGAHQRPAQSQSREATEPIGTNIH
jgi:hypothetical protein